MQTEIGYPLATTPASAASAAAFSFTDTDHGAREMTPHAVDLQEAQRHLPELVDQAVRGAEIIVTQGGESLVKLVSRHGNLGDRHCR